MRPLCKAAFLIGAATIPAGQALSCVTFNDDFLTRMSNVVADGTATCDVARGSCLLRATNVVKDDSWRRAETRSLYRFRFEPGANARLRREAIEHGYFVKCLTPWEPEASQVEGRFYLRREGSRLAPRQESARGRPQSDAEGDPE